MKASVAISFLIDGTAAFMVPQPGAASAGATPRVDSASRDVCCRRKLFVRQIQDHARGANSPSSASVSPDPELETTKATYCYERYCKPIVLVGLSSSPENDELGRLAFSLSGALAGNNPKALRGGLGDLDRSHLRGMLGDVGARQVAGISLSAVGRDEEGPFLLDTALTHHLIEEKTLSLTSSVIVLDFNHAAFDRETEADLTRAMSSISKRLYEDEGLMSVYVNVEPDDEVSERKKAIEKEVLIPFSDYELCIKDEGADSGDEWAGIEWELQRIIARALLPSPIVGATSSETPYNSADLMIGLNTFLLSLPFPQVDDISPYVKRLCQDVDYMEYRVDLLDVAKEFSAGDKSKRFDVMYQQQRLRLLCRHHAQRAPGLPFAGASIIDNAFPVVYTVRTAGHGGTWPDDEEGIKKMFELLELGLRSGVECLDVESAWDKELTDELITQAQERYTSLILGSQHVIGTQVTMEQAVSLYRQCRIQGRAHGAKVVLSILSNDNNEDMLAYKASLAAVHPGEPEIPNISLLLGEIGSYSYVLNPRFTPVAHEALPLAMEPGQLTAAEIMACKILMRMLPAQKFGILGHGIGYSVSPQMQVAAFAAVKLPHSYTSADLDSVEEFVAGPLWNDDNFGGCSVTTPHKQAIIPHLDVLTDAAKEVGSVSTVIVKKNKSNNKRILIGDNTDWKGIYNPLRRKIGKSSNNGEYALILGGGETARAAAYAAKILGLECIYWNRVPGKARDLANSFGGTVACGLEKDGNGSLGSILATNWGEVKAVISTIPKTAEFELPEWLFLDSGSLPVVFDAIYLPYKLSSTPLLLQAIEAGCDVVPGWETLWEQGAVQFELWTGRMAPHGVMKKVVLENCLLGGEEVG